MSGSRRGCGAAAGLNLGVLGGIGPVKRHVVAGAGFEAKGCEGLGEMGRKLGRHVDLLVVGSVDLQPAGMKVELAADPAGQERVRTAIFGVADDRMTEMRHVRA